MAQKYISQVSEEIEGRVTEKLSKEFSRTESRILGALSKLDEFLLNPQIQTCSIAVPGISRSNDSENLEPCGDCSLDNPCPEAVFSTYHSSNLNDSEQEETHHSDDCHRLEAQGFWKAVVQVRQKTDHRKTFYYFEQLIPKYNKHSLGTNGKAEIGGVDFFFAREEEARKFFCSRSCTLPLCCF